MKKIKHLYFILLLIFFSKVTCGQQHYVIEIDRINDTKTYKKLQFIKGSPEEIKCPAPSIENGDIITVRMVNFNELLYALDVNSNFIKKEKSTLSKVVSNAAPLLDMVSMTGSISLLKKLTENPPSAVENNNNTRGLDDENSINNANKEFSEIVSVVAKTQSNYKQLVSSEAISLDSLKESINELSMNISIEKNNLIERFNKIKNLIDNLEDENQNSLEYKRLKYLIENYDSDEIKTTISKIAALNKLLSEVDFIQERTFIVTGKTENSETFYLDALVYKRERFITEKAGLLSYYNNEESKTNGDQIRQNFRVELKVKHKNQLYFNFSVNQIFIPQNSHTFSTSTISTNNLSGASIDSFKFTSNDWGGSSKTSFGLNINYNLPDFNSELKTACLIGYSMIFNNSQNSTEVPTVKKGFLMTGFSIKSTRFQYLSLSLGCAWSKYDYLSSKYQVDKKYSSEEISSEERKLAIGKKVKPAFFVGLNINL